MFVKSVLVFSCLIFAVGVDGYQFERYYGKSILGFLNATWSFEEGFSPVKIVLNALDGNHTASEQCVLDLRSFKRSLEQLDVLAMQMADSSGGVLSGSLSGNLVNLGSYDECMASHGAYCKLRITLPGAIHQLISYVPHNVPIIQTICVPKSCGPNDIESLVQNVGFGSEMMFSASCQRPPPTWGAWEICGALLVLSFILSLVASTVYDVYWTKDYEGFNSLWCSFSLKRNILALKPEEQGRFACLDGIRAISQFCVIAYHVMRNDLKTTVPVQNKFTENNFLRSWRGAPIAALPLVVDTFSVVSGFMVTYSIMRKTASNKMIPKMLFNRFMRIYPPYIIGLLLMLTLAGVVCDGPLCESIIYSRQDLCKRVWWTNVLTIQNIYPGMTKSCMSHTWFVATDWQLYLILSPLVSIGLRESKTLTIWAIVGMGIGAMITMFTLTIAYDLRTDTLWFDRGDDAAIYYDLLYTRPYSRLAPWSVGLLFGIFMHDQQRRRITMTRQHVMIVWSVVGVLMPVTVYSILPFQSDSYDSTKNNIGAALFNSLSKPIWSVSICWLIFACSTGYGGPISHFLSGGIFPLLSKLSYSAYIIHKLVVNLYFANLRTPLYLSWMQQATTIAGLISLSFMSAFAYHLVAEAPFAHIAKFLLHDAFQRTNVQRETDESNNHKNNTNQFSLGTLEFGRTASPRFLRGTK